MVFNRGREMSFLNIALGYLPGYHKLRLCGDRCLKLKHSPTDSWKLPAAAITGGKSFFQHLAIGVPDATV